MELRWDREGYLEGGSTDHERGQEEEQNSCQKKTGRDKGGHKVESTFFFSYSDGPHCYRTELSKVSALHQSKSDNSNRIK